MRPLLRTLILLGGLACASPLKAQVTFTITATAESNGDGYTLGNSYTFIFTNTTPFTTLDASQFDAFNQVWAEERTDHDQLWSAISGTGLLGAFTRPTGDLDDPYSRVTVQTSIFGLVAATDRVATQTIGLTTLLGTPISSVSVEIDRTSTGPAFALPGSTTSLLDYFSPYNGSYADTTGLDKLLLNDASGSPLPVQFDVTNIQINPIPEPSTYAALLGLGALGTAMVRRRRPRVHVNRR